MPRLIQFEGQSISVPDDASDAEVSSILQARNAPVMKPPVVEGAAPATPGVARVEIPTNPKPQRSLGFLPQSVEGAARDVAIGAQGVGAGLRDIVLMPFDLAAGAQNLVTGGINKVFGTNIPSATPASQMAEKMAEPFSIPAEQMSPAERLAYNVNRFGTQGLGTGAALATRAPAVAEAAFAGEKPAGDLLNRSLDTLARPYQANPTRTVIGDVVGGAGAGTGVTAAEEFLPKEPATPLGQFLKSAANFVAPLAGGAGAVTLQGIAEGLGGLLRNIGNRAADVNVPVGPSGAPYTRADTERAARDMQSRVSGTTPRDAAYEIRTNANELNNAGFEPGQMPTSGLLSRDPGLVTAETGARVRNGGDFVTRDQNVKQAAGERVNSLRDPEADQGAVATAAQAERDARMAPVDQRVGQLEDIGGRVAGLRQQQGAEFAPAANSEARANASRNLDRTIVDEGYIPARAEKNRQFDEAPGRTEQLPADDVFGAIDRIRANANGLAPGTLPNDFMRRLDALRPRMVEKPEAKGEMDLAHGYRKDSGFSGFKPAHEVDDNLRYDGGGGVFGKDVTYLDPTGKWLAGEHGALGHDSAVRVKANFDKLFVLTPNNVGVLEGIVGPKALSNGSEIAAALKARGYDGIHVKGFDSLSDAQRFSLSLERVDSSIMQDQVAAFYPDRSLRVDRNVDLPSRSAFPEGEAGSDAYWRSRRSSVNNEVGTFRSSIEQQTENVGGPGTANGGDLADLRKFIQPAIEQAQRSGNFDLADNLAALKNAVNRTIEEAPGYAEANANYGRFADRYRPERNDEMAKFTREIDRSGNTNGDPNRGATPPSETAGRFLSSPEKAAALQRVLADAPNAQAGQAAVRDYMRSDFATVALNPDGTLNPAKASAWARNNADVLAQFPALRTEFDGIVQNAQRGEALSNTARTELDAARRNRNATEAEVDRSAIGTLLREDPRDVATKILNGGYGAERQLDEIAALVKSDPAAARGWKSAVSEVLTDRVNSTRTIGETPEVQYARLAKEFKDNEALLAKVYTPEEMNTLRQGHTLLGYFKEAEKRATVGSNTADKAAAIPGWVQLAARHVYGDLKGGGIVKRFKLLLDLLPTNKQSAEEIVHMAWFNPDVAAYLLERPVKNFDVPQYNINLRRLLAADNAARESGKN